VGCRAQTQGRTVRHEGGEVAVGITGHETPGGKMTETVTEIVMMDAEDKVNGIKGGDVTRREFSAWETALLNTKKLLGYRYMKINYD